ncbi:MAG: hypothetical protein Q3997_00185 [Propionibacteriaceae bacterium]|nr:hypothetical protein [Propionibacteriaceae bacterium]
MPNNSVPRNGFSFVVDLSQFDADDAIRHLTSLAGALRGHPFSLIAIVDSAPESVADLENLTLVETGTELNPVSRIGLAMQLVSSPFCVVSSTAVNLSPGTVDALCSALTRYGLVDLTVPTAWSLGSGCRAASSRTVIFGMSTRLYRMLRGFDLRIRTVRDAYTDLCRRARAWGEETTCMNGTETDCAVEPPRIELTSPQVFNFNASQATFVNLPRWLYRPFSGDPVVSLIRTGRSTQKSGYEAVAAQSFDDYEIVDANGCDPAALERAIRQARGDIIAIVGPGCVTPPWRLMEQLQPYRSKRSYCVGAAAFLRKKNVVAVPATPEAQPLTGPDPAGWGTLLAHREVFLRLLGGARPDEFGRVQTRQVVAAASSWPGDGGETAEPGVAQRVLPYLGGYESSALMLFDQYAVGRIDYIGAYDRIAAVATIYDDQRKPVREMAAVHSPSQQDIECLSRLGLPFEIIVPPPGREPAAALVGELLKKRFRQAVSIRPLPGYRLLGEEQQPEHHLLYLRIPGAAEGWFALADAPPGTGSPIVTTATMFSAQGQIWEQE